MLLARQDNAVDDNKSTLRAYFSRISESKETTFVIKWIFSCCSFFLCVCNLLNSSISTQSIAFFNSSNSDTEENQLGHHLSHNLSSNVSLYYLLLFLCIPKVNFYRWNKKQNKHKLHQIYFTAKHDLFI